MLTLCGVFLPLSLYSSYSSVSLHSPGLRHETVRSKLVYRDTSTTLTRKQRPCVTAPASPRRRARLRPPRAYGAARRRRMATRRLVGGDARQVLFRSPRCSAPGHNLNTLKHHHTVDADGERQLVRLKVLVVRVGAGVERSSRCGHVRARSGADQGRPRSTIAQPGDAKASAPTTSASLCCARRAVWRTAKSERRRR